MLMDNEASDRRGIREPVKSVDLDNPGGCEDSPNLASETVIVISSEGREEGGEAVDTGREDGNTSTNSNSNAKDDELSCVIDVENSGGDGNAKLGGNLDGERVCRICHLSSNPALPSPPATTSATATTSLIELGCSCKEELGVVHAYCAEAWFLLRGNRQCEICGNTAKNISGFRNTRSVGGMSTETRRPAGAADMAEEDLAWWQRQPFTNFLMACLVVALVLPWIVRVDIF